MKDEVKKNQKNERVPWVRNAATSHVGHCRRHPCAFAIHLPKTFGPVPVMLGLSMLITNVTPSRLRTVAEVQGLLPCDEDKSKASKEEKGRMEAL